MHLKLAQSSFYQVLSVPQSRVDADASIHPGTSWQYAERMTDSFQSNRSRQAVGVGGLNRGGNQREFQRFDHRYVDVYRSNYMYQKPSVVDFIDPSMYVEYLFSSSLLSILF